MDKATIKISANSRHQTAEFGIYGNHQQDIDDGYLIDFVSCFYLSDLLNGLTDKPHGNWYNQNIAYSVKNEGVFKHSQSGDLLTVTATLER
jgi:hypothetical protein